MNLHNLGLGKAFLDMTPKAQATKEKNELHQNKKFCAENDIKKVKRQPSEWKNIFASHIFDKELVSRTHKEHLSSKIKR